VASTNAYRCGSQNQICCRMDDFVTQVLPLPASLSHPTIGHVLCSQGSPPVLRTPRIVCLTAHTVRGAELLENTSLVLFCEPTHYDRRLLTPPLPPFLSPPPSRTTSLVGQYCCLRVLLGARTQRQGDGAGGCSQKHQLFGFHRFRSFGRL